MTFTLEPIGYFQTALTQRYDSPRQPSALTENEGVIQLRANCQFEQALEGLEGFDRLWVIFCFHRHLHWKPQVLPPRGGKKRGVFATRSPHRPNFIGLSCVQLKAIKGLKIFIVNHDLLHGTPILDLKPYLNYADSFISRRQGWLEELPPTPVISFEWSVLAQAQIDYLANVWKCLLQEVIEHRLRQSPLPYASNRVKQLKGGGYELAYRTWRVYYTYKEGFISIHHLGSGYDKETLMGKKTSKWEDVPIHQAFVAHFKKEEIIKNFFRYVDEP